MRELFTELRWLPKAPEDFASLAKAIATSSDAIGTALRFLASHALNTTQLTKLAKIVSAVRMNDGNLNPLVRFRLAILSNSTVDLIVPALVASALRHGIALEVIQPSYDQIAQEALTPDSKVNSSRPDAVLFALDYRALPLHLRPGDEETAASAVQGALGYLQTLRDGIKSNCNAVCIMQTLAPPAETIFGNLDGSVPGTLQNCLKDINRTLREFIRGSGDALIDCAGIAETVGLAAWHDTRQWNLAKFAFADDLIPLYADHVARVLGALRGKSRKALILDLDNTVWGGVIGDDGIEGINIAQGDATGEAHLDLQRMALKLRERGIVLAVSSKNTDEVARTPFLNHPEMLLKLEHFAVFQANWQDKATNIQAIADQLSLGLDAMVFVDDNPVERGLVRRLLPQVAVPELPAEPAFYARTVAAAGYFESIAFATEDLKRAGFYQDNARRATLQKAAGGVEAYLQSLNMTITFQPFDATGRARIVQLINKSNQYNLTTRRYTDPEVAAADNDPQVFTLQVRLSDIFGDNGMISVVICRPESGRIWVIDTWLMSCRVLGRRVEHMVLREILRHARSAGVSQLRGIFRPTDRNKLVVDHYLKLGFTQIGSDQGGDIYWQLQVDSASPESAPMQVVSVGFPTPLADNAQ